MKEYIECNNIDNKRMPMICIREESCKLQYVCMDFRRRCAGLPVIYPLKDFKIIKIPLFEKETQKICLLGEIKENRPSLINYSKYFEAVKKYKLYRRYNND